jgi:hypothetical protein
MFREGKSGNPHGRPKGAKNKVGVELRELINQFLFDEFNTIVKDFHKLRPREKVKVYIDFLQYGLPKLQSVSLESQLDHLSDDQINRILEQLTDIANEK